MEKNADKNNYIDTIRDIDTIRSMIQHEDNLINNRLSWTMTAQSFLIAGLSLLWGKDKSQPLILTILFFGVIINSSILYSMVEAINAIKILRNLRKDIPNEKAYLIPVQGSSVGIDFWFPWFVVPLSLIFFWITTFFIILCQT